MGRESKANPRSTQYNGQNPTPPMPEVAVGGDVTWQVEPSKAFLAQLAEMKAAGIDGPVTCREQDRDVVLYARAAWGVPIHTLREVQWSTHAMHELSRMPLVEFKKIHKGNFTREGKAVAAATIIIPDEPIIEG